MDRGNWENNATTRCHLETKQEQRLTIFSMFTPPFKDTTKVEAIAQLAATFEAKPLSYRCS